MELHWNVIIIIFLIITRTFNNKIKYNCFYKIKLRGQKDKDTLSDIKTCKCDKYKK